MARRLQSLVVAVAMGAAAWPVPGPVLAARFGAPDPLEEAERLYGEGLAAYETFDYERAIERWTAAYDRLSARDETHQQIRVDLIYNISSARIELYRVDGDEKQLRRAQLLLEKYLEESGAEGAEVEKVRERLTHIERVLAGEEEASATAPEPGTVPPPPPPGQIGADDSPGDDRPTLSPLTIAGASLLGVGAALGGAMVAGLVLGQRARKDFEDPALRDDAEVRGKRADGLAIGSGVAAAAAVAVGIPLLAVGLRRQRAKVAVGPWLEPTGGGLVLRGHF